MPPQKSPVQLEDLTAKLPRILGWLVGIGGVCFVVGANWGRVDAMQMRIEATIRKDLGEQLQEIEDLLRLQQSDLDALKAGAIDRDEFREFLDLNCQQSRAYGQQCVMWHDITK